MDAALMTDDRGPQAKGPLVAGRGPLVADAFEIELRLLLEAIYLRFHYDFRNYSMSSLRRRITGALAAMGCETVSALQAGILHDPETFSRLLQFLTVQVSDMFRDPPFFRTFRERIVPEIATYPSPRIWVAGASSGEEVYSLAIVLLEEGLLGRSLLYATDINPEALRRAKDGVYPLERFATFEDNHLAAGGKRPLTSYATTAYGRAALDRHLKERVVFSDHSLATDSVFAEVQVVTCRNVLIYFDRQLQDRALGLFGEALCRRGFLGLGSMESLERSRQDGVFEPFAAEERWYRRT
jgi:chemotaxis protein methyltransferase CheR